MARILVVDDEPDILTMIRFVLAKDGHEVSTASDGVEALRMLGIGDGAAPAKLPPDLIIMDLLMPYMDGVTLGRRLAENPATRSIPYALLTGKEKKDVPAGVHCLPKPFDPQTLREFIKKLLVRGK